GGARAGGGRPRRSGSRSAQSRAARSLQSGAGGQAAWRPSPLLAAKTLPNLRAEVDDLVRGIGALLDPENRARCRCHRLGRAEGRGLRAGRGGLAVGPAERATREGLEPVL